MLRFDDTDDDWDDVQSGESSGGALFWIRHTSAHSDKGPDSLEIHGMSCVLGRWYDGVASIPQSWVRPAHFRVKESRDLVSHVCSHY